MSKSNRELAEELLTKWESDVYHHYSRVIDLTELLDAKDAEWRKKEEACDKVAAKQEWRCRQEGIAHGRKLAAKDAAYTQQGIKQAESAQTIPQGDHWPSEEEFMQWWQSHSELVDDGHQSIPPGPQACYRWLMAARGRG